MNKIRKDTYIRVFLEFFSQNSYLNKKNNIPLNKKNFIIEETKKNCFDNLNFCFYIKFLKTINFAIFPL